MNIDKLSELLTCLKLGIEKESWPIVQEAYRIILSEQSEETPANTKKVGTTKKATTAKTADKKKPNFITIPSTAKEKAEAKKLYVAPPVPREREKGTLELKCSKCGKANRVNRAFAEEIDVFVCNECLPRKK